MAAADSTAFRALSDVVLAIASEHEVEPVLQRLVHSARELAGARYAALGIPDGEGAFASFITSGMSDELIEAMGPLPRTHGMLGAMLDSAEPHLTDDITADPRFRGWWPRAHPQMRSFLGVPIVARGEVIGALYLTEKEDGSMFSAADQRLIELLAAHAAIAIENARLHERSRELSIIEERNRLARELHDSVTQRLFGVALAAESASTLLARDPRRRGGRARAGERARARRDGGAARGRLRAAAGVAGGRGPGDRAAQARRGAAARVRAQRSSCGCATSRGSAPGPATQVLRIAQEALGNALRHSGADADRGAARTATTAARPDGRRRRLRLRSRRPGGARAAARADVDGGARDRARRDAEASARRSAKARPSGWRCPP